MKLPAYDKLIGDAERTCSEAIFTAERERDIKIAAVREVVSMLEEFKVTPATPDKAPYGSISEAVLACIQQLSKIGTGEFTSRDVRGRMQKTYPDIYSQCSASTFSGTLHKFLRRGVVVTIGKKASSKRSIYNIKRSPNSATAGALSATPVGPNSSGGAE